MYNIEVEEGYLIYSVACIVGVVCHINLVTTCLHTCSEVGQVGSFSVSGLKNTCLQVLSFAGLWT